MHTSGLVSIDTTRLVNSCTHTQSVLTCFSYTVFNTSSYHTHRHLHNHYFRLTSQRLATYRYPFFILILLQRPTVFCKVNPSPHDNSTILHLYARDCRVAIASASVRSPRECTASPTRARFLPPAIVATLALVFALILAFILASTDVAT